MSSASEAGRTETTSYEAEQISQIAAWKSTPPNPLSEMFRMITAPGARIIEQVIPDAVARASIERAYDLSDMLAGQEDVKRQAGVQELGELRHKPLEECDRLVSRVATGSKLVSIAEGAATGAGGPLTTLIDIPLLFVLALRTILKIGHCYGYPLDGPRDRAYVLTVLLAATSSSLHTRRERLAKLKDIEDMLLEETQQDVLAQEVASFLFQIEAFEEVPGVGAVSGALLNLGFIWRVDTTARRVFQERWLRENGKVHVIEPAEAPERALAKGWSGVLSRAAYSSCYNIGYGAALPVWFVLSLLPSTDNALSRGARDGAAAAATGVDRLLGRARQAAGAIAETGTPALASA